MPNNHDKVLKKLQDLEAKALALEAQAAGIREECHKTRCLLEDGVSTPSKKSKVNHAAVAQVAAKRKSFLNKKTQQVVTVGHL
jgi:hypothetical protein